MRYLLLTFGPAPVDTDWRRSTARLGIEVAAAGALRDGEAATTVRRRAGATLLADEPGPTGQLPSAFAVIDCADLDEAIAAATDHPAAAAGAVEIRPVVEQSTVDTA